MTRILIQFKREFWECRGSFIRTPLVMGGILMALLLLGIAPAQFKLHEAMQQMQENHGESAGDARQKSPEILQQLQNGELFSVHPDVFTHGLTAIYLLFAVVLLVVLLFYFVDTLYSDRRDQSILFWKSLPVSEHKNVLAKLGAGVGGAPIFYALAAFATGAFFLLTIIIYGRIFWKLPMPGLGEVVTAYLASTVGLVLGWWLLVLWLLPLFCWLLFSSAVAKKAPFLIAIGLPFALIVLEVWVVGSAHTVDIIKDQIASGFVSFTKILREPSEFGRQLINAVAAPAMWMGLIFSALLLATSIWLRTNRWEI